MTDRWTDGQTPHDGKDRASTERRMGKNSLTTRKRTKFLTQHNISTPTDTTNKFHLVKRKIVANYTRNMLPNFDKKLINS